MNPFGSRIGKYSVCALMFAVIGFVLFFAAAAPPVLRVPKGPIMVGAGPYPEADINQTEVVVSIPENSVNVRVTFRFNESRKYLVYTVLPYTISYAEAYAIYDKRFYRGANSMIGNISCNFMNSRKGSSIVNATFQPNSTYPFHFFPPDLKEEVTLAIALRLDADILAVSYPLGTSQTLILTFFGDLTGVWTNEMSAFVGPGSRQTVDWPFIVYIQLPVGAFLSETYPPPIEYYIKEERRWVMYSLDFLGGRYAQTVSCSFMNPTMQAVKEIMVFGGGVAVGICGAFVVLVIRQHVEKVGT